MDKRRMPGFSAEDLLYLTLARYATSLSTLLRGTANDVIRPALPNRCEAIDPWVDQSVVATFPPEASTLLAAATRLGATKKVVKIGSNLWT